MGAQHSLKLTSCHMKANRRILFTIEEKNKDNTKTRKNKRNNKDAKNK